MMTFFFRQQVLRKIQWWMWVAVVPAVAMAQRTAPFSGQAGPAGFNTGEYKFPATIDPDVLMDRHTEMWARAFWPRGLGQRRLPIIIFLHGNHATCGFGENPRHDNHCQYTEQGTCPSGYRVVPNHEGYNYLAQNLASWGYFVVSINANRGINCGGGVGGDAGLNLARGRLILKHLRLLATWATSGGAPSSLGLGANGLVGKLDFTQVGLTGHSRGGEGARAAYNLYREGATPIALHLRSMGMAIRGIFEIGAVDGQTSRVLDADGTNWNQLLPMCDGDVSNLEGRFPFERMLRKTSQHPTQQKSLYEVWGANHNFFNTEWQESDSEGCYQHAPIFPRFPGSPAQQGIALASVPAFFRSLLGVTSQASPATAFAQNFNPLFQLPSEVLSITRIGRDFTVSPGAEQSERFEEFDQLTGKNTYGFDHTVVGVDVRHQTLAAGQRAASLIWKATGGAEVFLETHWAASGLGRDTRAFSTLDLRIARQPAGNDPRPTRLWLQLWDGHGGGSNLVPLDSQLQLVGPGNLNVLFQTVRFPLNGFQGVDRSQVQGVRIVLDPSTPGAIFIANLRLSRQWGIGTDQPSFGLSHSVHTQPMVWGSGVRRPLFISHELNRVVAVRKAIPRWAPRLRAVEITVTSRANFPVGDQLPLLKIGRRFFSVARYGPEGRTDVLVFTLSAAEFAALGEGQPMTVQYGLISPTRVYAFASFAKR